MTRPVKIYLVLDDWRRQGKSVYSTEAGVQLSVGDFHSGTTFPGTIELDGANEVELRAALRDGFQPVFWVLEAK
jgi:hypothetical protein